MRKFFGSLFKLCFVAALVAVLIGGVAVHTISGLAKENHALKAQIAELEARDTREYWLECNLNVTLFPDFDLDFLTCTVPMTLPTTWDYYNAYAEGDELPILGYDNNFLLAFDVEVLQKYDTR